MTRRGPLFTPETLVAFSGYKSSGKDRAGEHLAEQYGYMHIALGDIVRSDATRHGLSHNRDVLVDFANRQRALQGEAYFCRQAIATFFENQRKFKGLAVTGLRAVAEAKYVKRRNGRLVFVTARPEIRFRNAQKRDRRDEPLESFEEFVSSEEREYSVGSNNVPAIEPLADITLVNEGSLEEFFEEIDLALGLK